MKYLKLFEHFFPTPDDESPVSQSSNYNQQLFEFIDSLSVDIYIKQGLKESQDLILIWNTHKAWISGIKDLMRLFQKGNIEYYNDYMKELGQNSHIRSFYDSIDDFINVLDRINKYLTHPEHIFILSEIFNYCNPAALRYLSDKCIQHILKNKHLIRKFQSLWFTPLSTFGGENPTGVGFISKSRPHGIDPFVPTSDKEHEDRIMEIILDSYSKK